MIDGAVLGNMFFEPSHRSRLAEVSTRVNQARLDKLLTEHDPFKAVV